MIIRWRIGHGLTDPAYCISALYSLTGETRKAYHIARRHRISPFACTTTSIPKPLYRILYNLIRSITIKLSGNSLIPIRNIRLVSSFSIVIMIHVGQPSAQGTCLTERPPCLSYSVEIGVRWSGREADRSPRINIDVKNEWVCISTPSIRLHLLRWHKLPFGF
jgi:hypothetical protein